MKIYYTVTGMTSTEISEKAKEIADEFLEQDGGYLVKIEVSPQIEVYGDDKPVLWGAHVYVTTLDTGPEEN